MIISKQPLPCQMLFYLAFTALIMILLQSLLSILLSVKPVLYFYLLFNLLVVVVGIRSGILNVQAKPSEYLHHLQKATGSEQTSSQSSEHVNVPPTPCKLRQRMIHSLPVELIHSDKVNHNPSLFFVGYKSYDDEVEVQTVDDVAAAGQELHRRADDFIEKFHKHLKMQREVSWKKLQDLCLKSY